MTERSEVAAENSGRDLHNRATRGEALTDAEQTTLQAWYDAEDAAENAALSSASAPTQDQLRADVDAALIRLQEVTQGLQRLSEENAALRNENAALAHRLARTPQAV